MLVKSVFINNARVSVAQQTALQVSDGQVAADGRRVDNRPSGTPFGVEDGACVEQSAPPVNPCQNRPGEISASQLYSSEVYPAQTGAAEVSAL